MYTFVDEGTSSGMLESGGCYLYTNKWKAIFYTYWEMGKKQNFDLFLTSPKWELIFYLENGDHIQERAPDPSFQLPSETCEALSVTCLVYSILHRRQGTALFYKAPALNHSSLPTG